MLPLALCAVFVWQFANPHYIVQKAMGLANYNAAPAKFVATLVQV